MSLLAYPSRSASADGEPVSRSALLRALATAALAPLLIGYLVTAAVLTLILAIATSSHFATGTVFATAGPVWLAAYQVPLQIGGEPLGVLPLLPMVGVCVLVARTARSAALRLGVTTMHRGGLLIGVIAGAHALAGGLLGVLAGDAFISVDVLAAVFVPAFVSAGAATVGVANQCGLTAELRRYLDPIAIRGLRAGALGIVGLLAAGGLTLLISTALSAATVGELFRELAPGAGSATGLWLLSLAYVPNAVVLALGFATGPGVELGEVAAGPFTFSGGAVPAFPLLGALPDEQAWWWLVFLLLPAAVGALVGWTLRTCHDDPMARLRTVGVAGALVGFGTVVAGFVAGGQLASGPFTPVGIPLGLVSIAAFLWIAVPGALVAWFAGPRPQPSEDATGNAEDTDAEDTAEDTDEADDEGAGDDVDEAGDDPDDDELDTDATGDDADETDVDADPDELADADADDELDVETTDDDLDAPDDESDDEPVDELDRELVDELDDELDRELDDGLGERGDERDVDESGLLDGDSGHDEVAEAAGDGDEPPADSRDQGGRADRH